LPLLYLLDTNIASFAIRNSVPGLPSRIREYRKDQLAVSVVTEAELLYGLVRKPEATRLNPAVRDFLAHVTILPWTSNAAVQYAHARAETERQGFVLDDLDMMIAAHALAEDAVLVTNDAVFHHIDRLRIEDWTRPL
jgi:tRNA(fMet)-specific endonuclease VapC